MTIFVECFIVINIVEAFRNFSYKQLLFYQKNRFVLYFRKCSKKKL